MDMLKLLALDAEDLKVVSAHVQDAVMKVSDLDWRSGERRFVVAMNRYAWEKGRRFLGPPPERRQSILHFEAVKAVRLSGIDRRKDDDVLSLLSLDFQPTDAPAGMIDLIFSGGGTVRLEVDYVEARLADLGAAWEARGRPVHPV